METAQAGIFALGTASHSYMEFTVRDGGDRAEVVRLVAELRAPQATTGGINLVAGFAPSLWRGCGGRLPPEVHDFAAPIAGPDGFAMPATQGDVWLWVAGHAYDKVFDTSRAAIKELAPLAVLTEEVAGWTYHDNRDLTGFIDGTENPTLSEAPEVALLPPGVAGAGGSVALVQKWVHLEAGWEALSVEEQEQVMGRTKADSVELDDEVRRESSHVSRTVLEEGGEELEIFRRNTPFGGPVEHGTMFVGFAADQGRLHRMLERMAGVGDGIRDALTLYATPLTGSYYFIPSIEALRSAGSPGTETPLP
ncbi:MAG: Dyp-type peroxidase [Candidatus Dormibacteria bacterium]